MIWKEKNVKILSWWLETHEECWWYAEQEGNYWSVSVHICAVHTCLLNWKNQKRGEKKVRNKGKINERKELRSLILNKRDGESWLVLRIYYLVSKLSGKFSLDISYLKVVVHEILLRLISTRFHQYYGLNCMSNQRMIQIWISDKKENQWPKNIICSGQGSRREYLSFNQCHTTDYVIQLHTLS